MSEFNADRQKKYMKLSELIGIRNFSLGHVRFGFDVSVRHPDGALQGIVQNLGVDRIGERVMFCLKMCVVVVEGVFWE